MSRKIVEMLGEVIQVGGTDFDLIQPRHLCMMINMCLCFCMPSGFDTGDGTFITIDRLWVTTLIFANDCSSIGTRATRTKPGVPMGRSISIPSIC